MHRQVTLGDVVLDPFCGCATTMEAAQKLGREWIGIDIAIHAIKRVARVRLCRAIWDWLRAKTSRSKGYPARSKGQKTSGNATSTTSKSGQSSRSKGFVTTKRSADGGVDGRVYFTVPHAQELQSMVIEVKGGVNVGINVLRELKGVSDYDSALMAGLIIMEPLGTVKARNFAKVHGGSRNT